MARCGATRVASRRCATRVVCHRASTANRASTLVARPWIACQRPPWVVQPWLADRRPTLVGRRCLIPGVFPGMRNHACPRHGRPEKLYSPHTGSHPTWELALVGERELVRQLAKRTRGALTTRAPHTHTSDLNNFPQLSGHDLGWSACVCVRVCVRVRACAWVCASERARAPEHSACGWWETLQQACDQALARPTPLSFSSVVSFSQLERRTSATAYSTSATIAWHSAL